MKKAAFIVAIEPYLVRTGMVAMLTRIPGIRVIREFDRAEPLVQFTRSEPGHFLIISRSLFNRSEALFLSQPGMLEKTILIEQDSESATDDEEVKTDEGLKYAMRLSDSREMILNRILHMVSQHGHTGSDHHGETLTERERTIVRLVSLGMTNRQIAEQLYLSTHTVITHRKNIGSKLGIKSVSGLTVYAIVNNIITIEEVTSNP